MIPISLKKTATKILESHPLGYALGVELLARFDFLLPHEADYWGFSEIISRGFGRHKLILDLGANCGHSARAFLKLLPRWNVFSFEANEFHRHQLEKIKAQNPDRYGYEICAVGKTESPAISIWTPFWRGFPMHSACAMNRSEALRGVQEAFPRNAFSIRESSAQLRSIDSFGLDADFVKMDIQGAELDCLAGMKDFLEKSRPILLVEVNLVLDPVKSVFDSMGFHPFSFVPEDKSFVSGLGSYNANYRNVFFVPEEHTRFVQKPTPA